MEQMMKIAWVSLIFFISLVLFSCGGASSSKAPICLDEKAYADSDGDGILNYEDADYPKLEEGCNTFFDRYLRSSLSSSWPLKNEKGNVILHFPLMNEAGSEPLKNIKFYSNIPYLKTESGSNFMDVFLPESDRPTGYVLFYHGGAFIMPGFDKHSEFKLAKKNGKNNPFRAYVNYFLQHNIAFVRANYRLIKEQDDKGVYRSLNDITYALQYIKAHAADFNLQPENVVLLGESAGMSAALWLGLKNDQKEPHNADPIKRQSTKVKAIAGHHPQASLHLFDWEKHLQSVGFSFKAFNATNLVVDFAGESRTSKELTQFFTSQYYGIKKSALFTDLFIDNINWQERVPSPNLKIRNMATDLNMMETHLDKDDPPIYIVNQDEKWRDGNEIKTLYDLEHHLAHLVFMKTRTDVVSGGTFKAYYKVGQQADRRSGIPFDSTNGKSLEQFVLEQLNQP